MRTLLLSVLFFWSQPAAADTLAELKASGKLVWGADQEGGGPYVYADEKDPNKLVGFEVEFAASIATALGVQAEFTQGLWENLPKLLAEKKVHVVMNGYEWTPERSQTMEASLPYYVYSLQLLVKRDNARIKSWSDLQKAPKKGKRWKVGVLRDSAAEEYMKKFADTVEVISFDGSTTPMLEVESKKLDATLQDSPIASFYADDYPKLHAVGPAVGKGYYVIYANKGETALINELNKIIIQMLKSKELEKIYQKHSLWDEAQSELSQIAETGKFLVTTDALGIVSAEGFMALPKSEAPAEEEEGGISYGVELDTNTIYSWRGVALSSGLVEQPSAWVYAGGVTVSAWASLGLNNADGVGAFQELDIIGEYELEAAGFTIIPRLTAFLAPGGSVGEVELELDHDLGPLSAFVINSVGFAGTPGSYFGQVGLGYERELDFGLALGVSAGLGFGNGIFNVNNVFDAAGVNSLDQAALDAVLTHAEGSYYFLDDLLYARVHVELSGLLDADLTNLVGEGFGSSVLLNGGLAIGFEM